MVVLLIKGGLLSQRERKRQRWRKKGWNGDRMSRNTRSYFISNEVVHFFFCKWMKRRIYWNAKISRIVCCRSRAGCSCFVFASPRPAHFWSSLRLCYINLSFTVRASSRIDVITDRKYLCWNKLERCQCPVSMTSWCYNNPLVLVTRESKSLNLLNDLES